MSSNPWNATGYSFSSHDGTRDVGVPDLSRMKPNHVAVDRVVLPVVVMQLILGSLWPQLMSQLTQLSRSARYINKTAIQH